MREHGLLIGEVAAKSGVSRKALRLYEKTGILPAPRRTATGYRVYQQEVLNLLTFVAQARRLGFGLDEIKSIVLLKRSGCSPCSHVSELVNVKLRSIERSLVELAHVREQLRELLRASKARPRETAAVCPCIEHLTAVKGESTKWNATRSRCARRDVGHARTWSLPATKYGSERQATSRSSRRKSGTYSWI